MSGYDYSQDAAIELLEAAAKREDEAMKCLVLAYNELNMIRARDGAPFGVSEKYFSELCDRIDAAVKAGTGQGAWMHPLLYAINDLAER